MNSAVAIATGTPITSATAEVISVPTTSGSAPNWFAWTSQLLVNVKPSGPNWLSAGLASMYRRMKK